MSVKHFCGFSLSLYSIGFFLLVFSSLFTFHRYHTISSVFAASNTTSGDINGDNKIDILDYNILLGCYSDMLPPISCNSTNKLRADLNNDGKVNQYDYNIFIRTLIALLNTVPPSPSPTPIDSHKNVTHWLITTNILNSLQKSDPTTTNWFFNTPNAFVKSSPVSDYSTTPIIGYTSYAQFQQDLSVGIFPKGIIWVLYNIESTTDSPLIEKQHPAEYLQKFAFLAHSHTLKVMEVPGRDLMLVNGADCVKHAGENLDQAYIRCQIPAASHLADIYLVEAQADQPDTTAYVNLVKEAVNQVHSFSPTITVMSGLTTDRGDTPTQIFASWQATHSMVSGYWMNSTTATLPVAVQALDEIKAAGGR